MYIKRQSVITGIEHTRSIPANPDDMLAWQAGMGSIHDLMPYLNDADREFLLAGITPEEWDEAFVLDAESEEFEWL